MSALYAPFEDIFAGQVREIQAHFLTAHEALTQWGRWSRDKSGIFPRLEPPALWDEYRTSGEGYGEELTEAANEVHVKPELPPEPPANEKQAVELDQLIHTREVGLVWRQVLKAAYYTREIPEYQMPRVAGLKQDRFAGSEYDQFICHLDAALRFIQGKMCDE